MMFSISTGHLLPSRLTLFAQVTDSEPSQSIEYVLDANRPLAVWLMVLIGIAIALGVLSLYFTEQGNASRLLRVIQASVRIGLILLVCWMLAGWQWLRFRSDRPDLLIVLDRSASMQTADMPSTESIQADLPETRLRAALHHLDRRLARDGESLKQRYRVRFWSIAEGLTPIGDNPDAWPTIRSELVADGTESRLGDSLQRLAQLQTGNATAAIIIATDGVVTGGTGLDDAAERLRKSGIPVFALAVGSISPAPDIQLIDALTDDMVFLGDRVSVEASVSAVDAAKQPVTVRLLDAADGRVLDSRSIELTSDRPQDSVTLAFTPERAGPLNLKIEAVPLASEKNTSNNKLEQVIEVRDQTLRVLLVHKSPSFEFRFLKTMLERSEQRSGSGEKAFELSAVLQDADAEHVLQDPNSLRLVPGDREAISRFDCFVLGNLDPALVPRSTQQMIVDQVLEQGAGLIFICDPAFDARKFANSPLQALFPFVVSNESQNNVLTGDAAFRWQPTALGKSSLPLQIESGNDADRFWQSLPGPQWMLNVDKLKPGAQVLAAAASESSSRKPPHLISQFSGAGRTAFQTSDETFRWTSFQGSDQVYQRYWMQMLRWLSHGKLNQRDISELIVEPRRALIGSPLLFSAKLGKSAAAALGDQPCTVQVTKSDGTQRRLELPRSASTVNLFRISESTLPAGNYRAVVVEPSDSGAAPVTFTVTAPPGEQADVRLDRKALETLAERTGGRMETIDKAETIFRNLPAGTPVRRGALPPEPLWNNPWVAALFVSLITAEWLLRRRANLL